VFDCNAAERHDWERYMRPEWERFMRSDWRDPKYWEGGAPPTDLNQLADCNARRKPAPLPQQIEAAEEEIQRERLALQKSIDALRLELAAIKREILLREPASKACNPNQPRVPAVSREGGQWADQENSGRDDSRILSDVTPDNDWKPGAQYA
jgi:hypothetical protein